MVGTYLQQQIIRRTPDSARFGGLRQMEMLIRDSGLEVVRA